jgi:hypothetical protein
MKVQHVNPSRVDQPTCLKRQAYVLRDPPW